MPEPQKPNQQEGFYITRNGGNPIAGIQGNTPSFLGKAAAAAPFAGIAKTTAAQHRTQFYHTRI